MLFGSLVKRRHLLLLILLSIVKTMVWRLTFFSRRKDMYKHCCDNYCIVEYLRNETKPF